MSNIEIAQNLRPLKFAYVVRPGDMQALERTVRTNSFLWDRDTIPSYRSTKRCRDTSAAIWDGRMPKRSSLVASGSLSRIFWCLATGLSPKMLDSPLARSLPSTTSLPILRQRVGRDSAPAYLKCSRDTMRRSTNSFADIRSPISFQAIPVDTNASFGRFWATSLLNFLKHRSKT